MTCHIATVTVNPAIDETIHIDALSPGKVHRAKDARFDVGGKGINVAACLADFGLKPVVTGYLGAENTKIFENVFKARHIVDNFIRRDGLTRTNIKIVDKNGTTDINLPGAPIDDVMAQKLTLVLDKFSTPEWLVVMSGSLAPQMPVDYYKNETERLINKGARVIVDCSGDALQALLSSSILPFVIKPNEYELSQWAGQTLKTIDEILPVARQLNAKGLGIVAVSMGGQGALFVTKDQALHAHLKIDHVESTVGAGDAMVAGISAALYENGNLERIARLGTAFAVGKLSQYGPTLPEKNILEKLAASVQVKHL